MYLLLKSSSLHRCSSTERENQTLNIEDAPYAHGGNSEHHMAGIKAALCSASPDHLSPFLQELPLALWTQSVLYVHAATHQLLAASKPCSLLCRMG